VNVASHLITCLRKCKKSDEQRTGFIHC